MRILSENSLISGCRARCSPTPTSSSASATLSPWSMAMAPGILKNVGITPETDALTGYPKLDDTGSNTAGGALGLQYLFNLDQQLVFEVAMVQPFEDDGIGTRRRNTASVFAIRSRSTGPGCSAPTLPINPRGRRRRQLGLRAEVHRKF